MIVDLLMSAFVAALTVGGKAFGKTFTVQSVKKTQRRKNPAPPFITSSLQQEASRKLNLTPKRTMMLAQQLYEGVELREEGSVGLITYMRTDSLRISEEALAAAGEVIRSPARRPFPLRKSR